MRAADGLCASEQAFVGDDVEHGQGRGAGDRVAGVGAAQAAGLGGLHDVLAADDAGKREAAGQ